MKDLLGKEHCCYKIYTLTESIALLFYTEPPNLHFYVKFLIPRPIYDFSNISDLQIRWVYTMMFYVKFSNFEEQNDVSFTRIL